MKKCFFVFFLFLILFLSCGERQLDPNKSVYVKIETNRGDVTVLLYDDTPLHRDNFIKLCQSEELEGVLFHRVIDEFVVQGGDPASKDREPGVIYGDGDGGYTVPAEILPNHFNKRGALIDAKEPDVNNVERVSAGTQFCFVQGKVLNDEELLEKEARINEIRRNWLYYKFRNRLKKQNAALMENEEELHVQASIMVEDTLALLGPVVISEERREIYKTVGGVPHLDGSVTVFGEVIEGLEVVEKISKMETDKYDRPLKDVIVKKTRVFQK